ncbi:MAG TPA: DNA translocase FtsK [Candidatus Scatomorpha merdavium]|nr:DNA translocase FtsK [Candidatus Scatomorpha merdavium]
MPTTNGSRKSTSSSGSAKKSGGTAKKPAASKNNSRSAKNAPKPIRREVGAAVCAFLAIFSFIGYFDVDGWFIDFFCGFVKGILGWGFYLFPPALLLAAIALAFHRGRPVAFRVFCCFMLPIIFGAIAHLLFSRTALVLGGSFSELIKGLYAEGKLLEGGGMIAGLLAMALESMFSVYGAFPLLLALLLFFLMYSVNLSIGKIYRWLSGRERVEYEYEPEPEPQRKPAPVKETAKPQKRPKNRVIDIPMDDDPSELEDDDVKLSYFTEDELGIKAQPKPTRQSQPAPEPVFDLEDELSEPAFAPVNVPPAEQPKPQAKPSRAEVEAETAAVAEEIDRAAASTPEYEFPPIDLLRKGTAAAVDGRDEIALNRDRLETTLHSFGVAANIVGVTRGPTVTRYDLELDAGVKLTKLTNLSSDLALSLGVMNVRIAPIPDKISTVGVEVPNKIVSIVYLRDIIDSPAFRNAQSSLSFAIGKDISGECVVGNIAKLPHMLIAGTTGSGKSVCLNSLLLSLLYKSTPEQVRLIMIDPKMVELGIYNGIPHLFVPVVTDPKKAAGALQWAVVEMLKRYRLFSEAGVRDLAGYNAHQKKIGGETMPQVVIVVDELADLMLVASKDVEESICRVAQMGRASGMHLIIATQRPSADVITGLMKANIPSRIAFAVSSAMESRIILDAAGAEKLIGMGDMLYSPLGSGKPMRIQGAYVSDEEREDVIDFIKRSSAPEYSEDILEQIEKAAEDKPASGSSKSQADEEPQAKSQFDELLPQAVDVIFETKQASVSMLQRRLKLGYSRAARLVDQMEQLGIVGPFEGSKPRQVLITKQQWQEMQLMNGAAPTERFQTEMEFGTDADEDADLP